MCLYSSGIINYTKISSLNQTEIFDYTNPKQVTELRTKISTVKEAAKKGNL